MDAHVENIKINIISSKQEKVDPGESSIWSHNEWAASKWETDKRSIFWSALLS